MADDEITIEMLSAGNDALADYWVELTTAECGLSLFPYVVAAIYRAMEQAKAQSLTLEETPQPQTLADSAL
jgi:hypothetical protein